MADYRKLIFFLFALLSAMVVGNPQPTSLAFFGEENPGEMFFMDNFKNQVTLIGVSSSPRIGITWNLTIRNNEASTSPVIVLHAHPNLLEAGWWEGIPQFAVVPNETRAEVYISHYVSDETPGLYFNLSLVEPTGNASGTYNLMKIEDGYPVDVGTSHLYVSNITAWLEQRTSVSTNYEFFSFGFIYLSGASTITLRRRKKSCKKK